jgi:hypothetical protein
VNSLLHPEVPKGDAPIASVPNPRLILNHYSSVSAAVFPAYMSQPAPMGIADYGLGPHGPFSYNTSHIDGVLTFNTPPNATAPGSEGVINPSGALEGYVGSVWEFSVQLNTVTTNITIPGSNSAQFWTQNVFDMNATAIHFVNDEVNFTNPTGYIAPNALYYGCGSSDPFSFVFEPYFQCIGPTVTISPTDFPLTIQLYNNASTNAQGRSQLTLGYRLSGAGGFVSTGIYDTVIFTNPNATAPTNQPGFGINGFTPTPLGEVSDAELIFGGQIGGTNAVFNSLNGTMNLLYSNASSDGWNIVRSAYNFGTDTGETSTGVAGYWTGASATTHIEEINAGPSFLYGLWDGLPWASVASGDIQFSGSISPDYGFVFLSNIAPGLFGDNMTIVPTNAAGDFNTYLPPAVPPGTSYYVQAFADGFAEYNGSAAFTTSQSAYAIAMTAAPGTLNAPLYMNGNAQAALLAKYVLGVTTGPYDFVGLTVSLNLTFTHLNEFYYPSFTIYQETDVTDAVTVGDDYQGWNYYGFQCYIGNLDLTPTGFLEPGPPFLGCTDDFLDQFGIFGSTNAVFTDELLAGSTYYGTGGVTGNAVTLWQDTGAIVHYVLAFDGSYGIFVGDSSGTSVSFVGAETGANAVDDFGSTHTTVSVATATNTNSFGVYAVASTDATYEWINATDYADGLWAGYAPVFAGVTDSSLTHANATDYAVAAVVGLSSQLTISDVGSYLYASGVEVEESTGITITNLNAYEAGGIYLYETDHTTIQGYNLAQNPYGDYAHYGSYFEDAGNTTLSDALFLNYWWGGIETYGFDSTFANVNVVGTAAGFGTDEYAYVGFESWDQTGFAGTDLASTYAHYAFDFEYSTGGTIAGVSADHDEFGADLFDSSGYAFTDVSATLTGTASEVGGVSIAEPLSTGNSVTGVTANDDAVGVAIWGGASGNTVTTVAASDDSIGVYLYNSGSATISGVTATFDSLGVAVDPSSDVTISGVTASQYSIGTEIEDSSQVSISGTTASNTSLGDAILDSTIVTDTGASAFDGNSTAVFVGGSDFVTVSGTKASATVLRPLYAGFGDLPSAAVVTEESTAVTVSDVTATNYGAAFYDIDSYGLQVNNVNATGSTYAVVLNGTYDSYFTGIGAYHDWVGLIDNPCECDDSYDNYVAGSSFVDDTSYGVAFVAGFENTVTGSTFIGDNGATGTYNPGHIQAESSYDNYFNTCSNYECTSGVGNYWADWHTYGSNGFLAPYVVSGAAVDMFPTGPQETFAVTFSEHGLATGQNWSVTLGGMTEVTVNDSITFTVPMGTYLYQVNPVAGYTVSPSSGGTITEAGAPYSVVLTFSAITYAVTLSESGLSAGTSWGATVNGVTQSTTGTTLTFYLPAGTSYAYSFNAVSGYNLPSTGASGTFSVTNQPVSLATTYSPTSTPSYVQTSDFNNWLAVAIAVAVIALVVGLLALLLRGRKQPPAQGAQAWTPPPAQSGGAPPVSGGSNTWSEGPPSGGSPPS